MKNMIIAVIIALTIFGCSDKSRPVPEGFIRGVITETMNSGGYTYMNLEVDNGSVWIASIQMDAKKGDTIYYSKSSMEMKNFHSETLNKTFNSIIFAELATKDPWPKEKNDTKGGMMGGKNPHKSAVNEKESDISIKPEVGSMSIEQIYAKRTELNGKTIKVKGQIVKYNSGIMGKNWAHIQDGSGSVDDFDLVITTNEEYNLGDVVTFEGTLSVEKDFGSGYKFTVVIENAKGAKELPQS